MPEGTGWAAPPGDRPRVLSLRFLFCKEARGPDLIREILMLKDPRVGADIRWHEMNSRFFHKGQQAQAEDTGLWLTEPPETGSPLGSLASLFSLPNNSVLSKAPVPSLCTHPSNTLTQLGRATGGLQPSGTAGGSPESECPKTNPAHAKHKLWLQPDLP